MKSYFLQRFFEIGVIIIGLICLGAYLSSTLPPDTLVVKNDVSFQSNETVEITLSGEVKSPGTYTVLEGTMLYDVIRKAGGVTDKADLSSFDLTSSVLSDSEEFIPEISVGALAESDLDALSDNEDGLLDINKATADELGSLPGIGDKTAKRIVEYRTQNGDFSVVDDIRNIKGIGDKTFEKIRNLITVD